MPIHPPTLQIEADGSLVLRKDRPGGQDVAELSVITNGSLGLGIVFILLPFESKTPISPAGMLVLISLGITTWALGGAGAIRYYRRITLGRWRIDGAGIEFRPANGEVVCLAWMEVDRIWWGTESCRLVGLRGQIRLLRELLPEPDWKTIRDRVEAELTPRFDLSPRVRPIPPFSWFRVLGTTIPFALLTGATFWALPRVPPRWDGPVALGWLLAMASATIPLLIRIRRDAGPRESPWRNPRSMPLEVPAHPT